MVLAMTCSNMMADPTVPPYINYQGRVAVNGVNFTGAGLFKFAIVSSGGAVYWNNGANEVSVPVSKGAYSVLLGDSATTNMASFQSFNTGGDTNIRLRIWFNDGVNGSQQLSPDQRIGSVPFAFQAGEASALQNGGSSVDLGTDFLSASDGTSSLNMGGGFLLLDGSKKGDGFTGNHDLKIGLDGVVQVVDLNVVNKIHGVLTTDSDIASQGKLNVDDGITTLGDMRCLAFFSTQGATIGGNVGCGGVICSGNVNAANVYAGNIAYSSDRELKENFAPVDARDILQRVVDLPVTSWNFKGDAATPHIGPMAQDFYSSFHLGTDEKHIGTVDEAGVALAAIQGLNAVVKEKDAKIADLERRVTEMEEKLNRIVSPPDGGAE